MLDTIKGLIKGNRICVLSTIAGDRPYCSLMRYTCDPDCKEIYLVTHRNTTKYQNLMANPNVSLLIDNRDKNALARVQALTIEGCWIAIEDTEKINAILGRFKACHPDLEAFVTQPEAELLRIEIQSFLLLNGLEDAHHLKVES